MNKQSVPQKSPSILEAKLTEELLQRLLLKIAQKITDEDMQYIQEASKNDPHGEIIYKFLKEKIPNLDELITQEMSAYKKDIQVSK